VSINLGILNHHQGHKMTTIEQIKAHMIEENGKYITHLNNINDIDAVLLFITTHIIFDHQLTYS